MMKKLLIGATIFVALLVVSAFALPILFKGKIMEAVKKGINEQVNAKVNFADADVSLFRHFPTLSLQLQQLSVVGIAPFEGDTLMSVANFDISLNLMSVLKGEQMQINALYVDAPRVFAVVNKQGQANWNITKPTADTATTAPAKPFAMQLKKYAISNAYISYKDEQGNMSAELSGLNHSGSGNFAADVFTAATKTNIEALSFAYGGVPYLKKVATSAAFDVSANTKESLYTFETDNVQLNELKLATGGSVTIVNDSTYALDVHFKAPDTQFKTLLSFIPLIYQNNFDKIKTSGSLQLDGQVKGQYSATQIPAFHVALAVKDGFFQYPDLPEAVKNIQLSMVADNADGKPDNTVVNISNAHFEMAAEPFDLKLLIKNPVSNMYVDAFAKGKLALDKVARFVKLPEGTSLSGLLTADATLKASLNDISAKQYQKVNAAGTIALNNFNYASKEQPNGVQLSSMLLTFNPKNVTLSDCNGKYDITTFSANGYLNNLLAYALKNEPLDGVLNVKAGTIDVNKLMGTTADTAQKASTTAPFPVPANLNLVLNAQADKVLYSKYVIDGMNGSVVIANERVGLNNVKGKLLEGEVAVNGYYDTKNNKKNPEISFNYDVKNVDIQKSFVNVVTVQKLLPIAEFISGKISSQFNMKGNLGQNMMPDWASLLGNGNLQIAQGVISKFAPIAKIAQSLSVAQLQQDYPLKDLKGVFQFANGKLLMQPFKIKANNIDMEIGGTSGFDKSIDYLINLKVPRSLMGAKGNAWVDNFAAQAAGKGVPVKIGDVVPVQVKLGGFLTNPTVKTDIKQAVGSLAQDLKQQAIALVQNKVDSTKKAVTTAVRDTVKSVTKTLVTEAKSQVINQILNNKKDSTAKDPKKTIEEAGKGLLKNLNPFKKN